MKAFTLATVAGFALLGTIGSTLAQPYGGYGGPDRDYRDDDRRDRRERRDYRDDRRGGRGISFDESEYLRCNPDVRRAVRNGQVESGRQHFEAFGRREGRRLEC
ncbi:hypothetical protein [uncultured Enterovirga sp.]|uniref:hypothetical protein n=1 Tax=uncultured Enterovirga sp. TaxID=2026352 RepID=UPI0035CA5E51